MRSTTHLENGSLCGVSRREAADHLQSEGPDLGGSRRKGPKTASLRSPGIRRLTKSLSQWELAPTLYSRRARDELTIQALSASLSGGAGASDKRAGAGAVASWTV